MQDQLFKAKNTEKIFICATGVPHEDYAMIEISFKDGKFYLKSLELEFYYYNYSKKYYGAAGVPVEISESMVGEIAIYGGADIEVVRLDISEDAPEEESEVFILTRMYSIMTKQINDES